MPYESIADARKAGFPCSAEDIDLTLAQINKLAEFYDAIKKAGSADNPMAAAWKQWKETYKKEGDKWVLIKKEGEHETHTQWIKVAKKDQKKIFEDGTEEILDERALISSAESFKGKNIEINHKVPIEKGHEIRDVKYEAPFLSMQFDPKTQDLFKKSDASGWSVKFEPDSLQYEGNRIVDGVGKNISVLYYPHVPACTPEMGCFETFEFKQDELEGNKMEEESKMKSVVDEIKGMFEQLMAIIKKDKKEEIDPKTGKKENMDKVEELTSQLAVVEDTQKKAQSEFETMQTDHTKEVKELKEQVAAFEQEKLDVANAELSAQWEQLKKEVIPPGLVAKDEDIEKLKGEFEQHPHAFIQRMATFKTQKDKKEEGAEFESEHNESLVAIKELKEDTGRI